MKRLFYDFEQDEYITLEDLKKDYELMTANGKEDYNMSFSSFVSSCMHCNNGSLYTIEERERRLISCIKGFDLESDDIDDLYYFVSALRILRNFKCMNS